MEGAASEHATILIVDDIAANRALARETLEDAGHQVIEAATGQEALTQFAKQRPDCVLLDIRMPGIDGFEVCARMRAMPDGAETPILFVTALRDIETFDRALEAGGFDFLTKPLNPAELLVRVRAALMLKRTSVERDSLSELLRQQRDHLMRAVLLNERLTTFVVHDLKNPVAGLQLASDLIRKDPHSSERCRDIAERMHAQTGELLRMILVLLDIAKGEEGQLVLSKSVVQADPLVRSALEGLALRAEARRIVFATALEVEHLTVDANLFRRVLENLLDNALRHAPEGSTVRVSLTPRDGASELRVADAGRGVPPELRERIFDRYVQADKGLVARAGRGLGLAFCKLVVEAHGGRVWVEDASPGAVFCTRWPDGG